MISRIVSGLGWAADPRESGVDRSYARIGKLVSGSDADQVATWIEGIVNGILREGAQGGEKKSTWGAVCNEVYAIDQATGGSASRVLKQFLADIVYEKAKEQLGEGEVYASERELFVAGLKNLFHEISALFDDVPEEPEKVRARAQDFVQGMISTVLAREEKGFWQNLLLDITFLFDDITGRSYSRTALDPVVEALITAMIAYRDIHEAQENNPEFQEFVSSIEETAVKKRVDKKIGSIPKAIAGLISKEGDDPSLAVFQDALQEVLEDAFEEQRGKIREVIGFLSHDILGFEGGAAKRLSERFQALYKGVKEIEAEYLQDGSSPYAFALEIGKAIGEKNENGYKWGERYQKAIAHPVDVNALRLIYREILLERTVSELLRSVSHEMHAHLSPETQSFVDYANEQILSPIVMHYVVEWADDLLITAPRLHREAAEALEGLSELGDQGVYFSALYNILFQTAQESLKRDPNRYMAELQSLPFDVEIPELQWMINDLNIVLLHQVVMKEEGTTFDERFSKLLQKPLLVMQRRVAEFSAVAEKDRPEYFKETAAEMLEQVFPRADFETRLPRSIANNYDLYDLILEQVGETIRPYFLDVRTFSGGGKSENQIPVVARQIREKISGELEGVKGPRIVERSTSSILQRILQEGAKKGALGHPLIVETLEGIFCETLEGLPEHAKAPDYSLRLLTKVAIGIRSADIPSTEIKEERTDEEYFHDLFVEVKGLLPIDRLEKENKKMVEENVFPLLESLVIDQVKSFEDPRFEMQLLGGMVGVEVPEKGGDLGKLRKEIAKAAGKKARTAFWGRVPFGLKLFFLPFLSAGALYAELRTRKATEEFLRSLDHPNRKEIVRKIVWQAVWDLRNPPAEELSAEEEEKIGNRLWGALFIHELGAARFMVKATSKTVSLHRAIGGILQENLGGSLIDVLETLTQPSKIESQNVAS